MGTLSSISVSKAKVTLPDDGNPVLEGRFVARRGGAYVLSDQGLRIWYADYAEVKKVDNRHWRLTLVEGQIVEVEQVAGCGCP